MPGFKDVIISKSGTALVYATNGLPVFGKLPKSSVTGLPIEGAFLNTSFRPKLRLEVSFEDELVALVGATPTEARVRSAVEKLKVKAGTAKAPAKKAKAKASPKKAPKEALIPMPSMEELTMAKFEAMEKLMADLQQQLATKAT